MTSHDQICAMDAKSVTKAVRNKELSPVEVLDAVLQRVDALDGKLHAFCTLVPEMAREAAVALEFRIAKGEPVGALAGVPVGIKDLVLTKGIRTTAGSMAYQDFIPDEDDVVVERLKAEDAVVIGKTNVPEFGYSGVGQNPVFETTRNPWNLERTPGGSSSGSGAAVAAGMGPFTIGSDGGGSIRIPSSFCGLFGLKASMGRVPLYPGCRDERYPGVSSWETLEHIGPMSRTVADGALMMSVIAGPDDRDRHSLPKPDFDWLGATQGGIEGLRIAYSEDWGYARVEPEVRAIVRDAVGVFERDFGCVVEEANPGFEDPLGAFWALVVLETDLRGMRQMATELGDKMSPHLSEMVLDDWSAEALTDAVVARKAIQNKMWRFMRQYDLLLTPTVAVPPFGLGVQGPEEIDGKQVEQFDWLPFTAPLNMTGQPAATVPAGLTADGLPVGMQIAGPHLGDELVLRASAAFEQARPWSDRWPSLVRDLVNV